MIYYKTNKLKSKCKLNLLNKNITFLRGSPWVMGERADSEGSILVQGTYCEIVSVVGTVTSSSLEV